MVTDVLNKEQVAALKAATKLAPATENVVVPKEKPKAKRKTKKAEQ